ncbi:MAG: GNAT family N-acetyltransferase [Lentisphaeria bacterium]|nr:GNAT family N-acetyltransferase [Lentisphaeria bacterium]
MNISIRLLGKDELKLVRQVADIVWPVTFKEILSPEQIAYMMEMMYAQSVMDKEFDEGIHFYGVFDGTDAVGYLIWGHYDGAPQTAKLHKCYLLTDYQGKGIGSMMLQTAKAFAREAGYKHLRLNVNRQNAKAIKAYVRNDFKTIETVDNPIGNGFFMNDYVMETDL